MFTQSRRAFHRSSAAGVQLTTGAEESIPGGEHMMSEFVQLIARAPLTYLGRGVVSSMRSLHENKPYVCPKLSAPEHSDGQSTAVYTAT